MTYDIPVDGYDGRVSLQTVARRIARACVHFLQVCACPFRNTFFATHHLLPFFHNSAGEYDSHLMGSCDPLSLGGDLARHLAACPLHQLKGCRGRLGFFLFDPFLMLFVFAIPIARSPRSSLCMPNTAQNTPRCLDRKLARRPGGYWATFGLVCLFPHFYLPSRTVTTVS